MQMSGRPLEKALFHSFAFRENAKSFTAGVRACLKARDNFAFKMLCGKKNGTEHKPLKCEQQ